MQICDGWRRSLLCGVWHRSLDERLYLDHRVDYLRLGTQGHARRSRRQGRVHRSRGQCCGAPQYLIAAGIGDSLCRPTAQVDWAFSHKLLGTRYLTAPYALQAADEPQMLARSAGLGRGGLGRGRLSPSRSDPVRIRHQRGWVEPPRLHGRTSDLALDRQLRRRPSSRDGAWPAGWRRIRHNGPIAGAYPSVARRSAHPPRFRLTRRASANATPAAAVEACLKAARAKAMDSAAAAAFNARLERLWPTLRQELKPTP